MTIEIKWISDQNECDQCGGGYAQGALVYLGGELICDMVPEASCCDGTHYEDSEVYTRIIMQLLRKLELEEKIVNFYVDKSDLI